VIGASDGTFGVFGVSLANIALNWKLLFLLFRKDEDGFHWCLCNLFCVFAICLEVAINSIVGFTSCVDNFAHMGGSVCGFLLGLTILKRLPLMNSRVMDRIDALRASDDTAGLSADSFRGGVFTHVNWGAAVEPRSFGKERNVGDHVAHCGLESRLVLFQMMTNHLRDSGFFAQPTNNVTARLPL
jgi:hypothetical protein